MNTYEITTTHGVLNVKGDEFETITDDLTGEQHCGFRVTNDGKLAAFIPDNALISVIVHAEPELKPEPTVTNVYALDATDLADKLARACAKRDILHAR